MKVLIKDDPGWPLACIAGSLGLFSIDNQEGQGDFGGLGENFLTQGQWVELFEIHHHLCGLDGPHLKIGGGCFELTPNLLSCGGMLIS